jgi:hypothetical protein
VTRVHALPKPSAYFTVGDKQVVPRRGMVAA